MSCSETGNEGKPSQNLVCLSTITSVGSPFCHQTGLRRSQKPCQFPVWFPVVAVLQFGRHMNKGIGLIKTDIVNVWRYCGILTLRCWILQRDNFWLSLFHLLHCSSDTMKPIFNIIILFVQHHKRGKSPGECRQCYKCVITCLRPLPVHTDEKCDKLFIYDSDFSDKDGTERSEK